MATEMDRATEIARVVCEALERVGVGPDIIAEEASRLVEDLTKAIGEDIVFAQRATAEVGDILYPPCDADFEDLCDDD